MIKPPDKYQALLKFVRSREKVSSTIGYYAGVEDMLWHIEQSGENPASSLQYRKELCMALGLPPHAIKQYCNE